MRVFYPCGEDAVGQIIYTADGYMAANLAQANRPHVSTRYMLGGPMEERAAAANTYVAYAGPYELHGDQVTHVIESSLHPNWVGTRQQRRVELADGGNRLILRSPPVKLEDGTDHFAVLEFRRARTG